MNPPRRTPVEPRKAASLPSHIANWQLPPGWAWGKEGLYGDQRHYQQVTDGLGRSLSLVTAPDPAHHKWIFSEAKNLAHRGHPTIPTTYHFWHAQADPKRGPGYLRRWITGETVRAHLNRLGRSEIPYVLQVLRGVASSLSSLHDNGVTHGALTQDTVWVAPTGRLWMLEWQWAIPREEIPEGMRPLLPGSVAAAERPPTTRPPEWANDAWLPTPASDQWQLASICFAALTGEEPPSQDIPPVRLIRPETPASIAAAIDRALSPDPNDRYPTTAAMLRAGDTGYSNRSPILVPLAKNSGSDAASHETRVRWAVGDDYELLSPLGSGNFGRVWRARDLSLEREVALKVLHPHVAADAKAVNAFWSEAKLAAQLAHPSIVPIYDWDSRDDLSWYTMELADEGSIANLVARSGPRSLDEIAPHIEQLIDGLAAAHGVGIVHRDLKPENILIDRYGRWRMTDFGIANATGEDVSSTTGTPAFAAPEQLLGEPQGASVDYFALAAIVAFALSGQPPFGDGDPETIIVRQMSGKFDASAFSPPIAEWLKKALMLNAEDRFADAAEMKEAWNGAVRSARRRERAAWWRRNSARPKA